MRFSLENLNFGVSVELKKGKEVKNFSFRLKKGCFRDSVFYIDGKRIEMLRDNEMYVIGGKIKIELFSLLKRYFLYILEKWDVGLVKFFYFLVLCDIGDIDLNNDSIECDVKKFKSVDFKKGYMEKEKIMVVLERCKKYKRNVIDMVLDGWEKMKIEIISNDEIMGIWQVCVIVLFLVELN